MAEAQNSNVYAECDWALLALSRLDVEKEENKIIHVIRYVTR